MKRFRELRETFEPETKIIASEKFQVLRDGGSHCHEILNPEECGFCQVIQDFSIGAKKMQREGRWFVNPNPPNHTKQIRISPDMVKWV